MNDDSIDYSNDSDGSIGNSDNSDDNAMADQDVQQGGDSLPLEDDEEDWGKFIELNWYRMEAAFQIIICNIILLRFGATSLAWNCTLGTSFLIK